jgi:hypothetical protein
MRLRGTPNYPIRLRPPPIICRPQSVIIQKLPCLVYAAIHPSVGPIANIFPHLVPVRGIWSGWPSWALGTTRGHTAWSQNARIEGRDARRRVVLGSPPPAMILARLLVTATTPLPHILPRVTVAHSVQTRPRQGRPTTTAGKQVTSHSVITRCSRHPRQVCSTKQEWLPAPEL